MTAPDVEVVARILCRQHGSNPDALEPGDADSVDGVLPNGDKAHFRWKDFAYNATEIAGYINRRVMEATAKLQDWKDQTLTVESWWLKVDEAVRAHPDIRLGDHVSATALRFISEHKQMRATVQRLNRRAQEAESIIHKAGLVENRPQTRKGRSLGRALANYAASQFQRDLATSKAECNRLWWAYTKLRSAIAYYQVRDRLHPQNNSPDAVFSNVMAETESISAAVPAEVKASCPGSNPAGGLSAGSQPASGPAP